MIARDLNPLSILKETNNNANENDFKKTLESTLKI